MAVRRARTTFRSEPFPASKIGIGQPITIIPETPQSVEFTDIPSEEPVLVPTESRGRRQRTIRERAGPNARVRMRRAFRERQKDLKKALAECNRDLKSLTTTKKKSKKRAKKSTKKNAKKGKK